MFSKADGKPLYATYSQYRSTATIYCNVSSLRDTGQAGDFSYNAKAHLHSLARLDALNRTECEVAYQINHLDAIIYQM
jgi:hypothetical protein